MIEMREAQVDECLVGFAIVEVDENTAQVENDMFYDRLHVVHRLKGTDMPYNKVNPTC